MAATVSTGKTHSRFGRILCDGANLSGDARSLGNVGISYEEPDFTGWSDSIMVYQQGRGTISFGPFQALFNNKAAATGPVQPGSYTALNGQTIAIATYAIGIGEAPTIGAPAFSADVEQMNALVEATGGNPVIISGDFSGAENTDGGWGQLVAAGASVSSTTSNASLDGGASSSNGFLAFLHVTQSAGAMGSNNWAIKLEHGTNDSTWADLTTAFTLDGSVVGAQKVSASGTVNRYVRATATKTAGTDIIYWINFVRL
jgi:hypothetical protein